MASNLARGRCLRAPELALRTSAREKSIRRQFFSTKQEKENTKKERVVILGSGWAGYAFARTLDPAKFERIVISPRSYFVFTPLLASTSVGTLEFRSVLEPVRRLNKVRFYQGWADDIDFTEQTIRVETNPGDDLSGTHTLPPPVPKQPSQHVTEAAPGTAPSTGGGAHPVMKKGDMFDVKYDKLVVAVGAYSQTFNIPGVRQHAHFLRDIGDARRIRLRVLSLFEQCSYPNGSTRAATIAEGTGTRPLTEAEKRHLLHFAIVGGGPTGIEFAAELHDLIYEDLANIYPELVPLVRITVYDVAPKVLPMFDEALAKYAMETFSRQGIEVKTEHHLEGVTVADGEVGQRSGGLRIKIKEEDDGEVGAGLVVWSTGLMQNPLVEKLVQKEFASGEGAETVRLAKDAKTGGIVTDGYLRARLDCSGAGHLDNVYMIGDCAVLEKNPTLPKTAQVASQQAIHLAKMMNKGDATRKPFEFTNWGAMTYLGSWKAIHQSPADELRGWIAWVLWRGAYLTKSMSIRNKIMVPVYWMMSWLFGRDISRF